MSPSPRGWRPPEPAEPRKPADQLRREREEKVRELQARGYLSDVRIRRALLAVPREDFVPRGHRDHAYEEVPLPLPGARSTISCPHSYPLFYEPLGLAAGHRFLEVGLGSGYGAAVAREVVGEDGLVVSVELDPTTLEFGRANLERAGYEDVVVVRGDGRRGHPERAPYDRISLTAACRNVPEALLDQLSEAGRLIAPVTAHRTQRLTLYERTPEGIVTEDLAEVLYMDLRQGGSA